MSAAGRDYSIPVPPRVVETDGEPSGVAVTPDGTIVVTTSDPDRLLFFEPTELTPLRKVGLDWAAHGVAVDADGNVLLCGHDWSYWYRVAIVDEEGKATEISGKERHPLMEQSQWPRGIALDRDGNVVVGDPENHRVHVITREGVPLRTFGTKGKDAGQFDNPWFVAVNKAGEIAVADYGNPRVQLLSSDGAPIRMLGGLDYARGVAFDGAGNIVVTDEASKKTAPAGHERVVVFSPSGAVVWQCGSHGYEPGQFRSPQGVAVLHDGRIVVADSGNRRIQVV